ncbi:MAG: hypothetical protein AAB288_01125 [Acidobacteriota bacterium]
MSNNNVVRPVFGQKRSAAPTPVPVAEQEQGEIELFDMPTDSEAIQRVSIDLMYIMQDMDHVQRVRDYISEATDFIFAMANYQKSDANIKERQIAMQHFTLEQICVEIMKSSQADWQSRPSHFGALMLEYQIRVNGAMSLLPK